MIVPKAIRHLKKVCDEDDGYNRHALYCLQFRKAPEHAEVNATDGRALVNVKWEDKGVGEGEVLVDAKQLDKVLPGTGGKRYLKKRPDAAYFKADVASANGKLQITADNGKSHTAISANIPVVDHRYPQTETILQEAADREYREVVINLKLLQQVVDAIVPLLDRGEDYVPVLLQMPEDAEDPIRIVGNLDGRTVTTLLMPARTAPKDFKKNTLGQ